MNNQQSYSHGLLYSVSSKSLETLHLNDEETRDKFDWEAYESEFDGDSFVQVVYSFLKTTAVGWGFIKLN